MISGDIISVPIFLDYKVEKRILSVEFFVYFYSMVQDINLKIGIYDPQVLSNDIIKAQKIDSASVLMMTIIMVTLIIL